MGKYLSSKDICALVRADLKKALPQWKFSVTKHSYSGGSSITLALVSGPEEVCSDGYAQLNHYYLGKDETLTAKGLEVMREAIEILESYHWDKSDAQIDYFSCNFYMHFAIGKYDQPYEVKPTVSGV